MERLQRSALGERRGLGGAAPRLGAWLPWSGWSVCEGARSLRGGAWEWLRGVASQAGPGSGWECVRGVVSLPRGAGRRLPKGLWWGLQVAFLFLLGLGSSQPSVAGIAEQQGAVQAAWAGLSCPEHLYSRWHEMTQACKDAAAVHSFASPSGFCAHQRACTWTVFTNSGGARTLIRLVSVLPNPGTP